MDPREDSWARIDKEIEFITVNYPDPSQGQTLDAICRALDTRAEEFRVPSPPIQYSLYQKPLIPAWLKETKGPPWIVNVISTENERSVPSTSPPSR